jgi:hypothetical protein
MGSRIVDLPVIALSLLIVAGVSAPADGALSVVPRLAVAGQGSLGIQLIPSSAASGDPLARSYIVERLAPGTRVRRSIEIINGTRRTADVAVYPAAATLLRGIFGFAAGHTQNAPSSWTSVSRGRLNAQPGSTELETVTIKVPKGASPGERYAVVWAQVSAPAPTGGGVTLVNRVGVRMYLSIGPGGTASRNFAVGPLIASRSRSGKPVVVSRISNIGAGTLDISGRLTLTRGPGGLGAGPFAVELGPTLAPRESEQATVQLNSQLPRGPWRAKIVLTSGSIERVTSATITFPARREAATSTVSRASPSESRRLVLGFGVLVLLTIAASGLVRFRRRSTLRSAGDRA